MADPYYFFPQAIGPSPRCKTQTDKPGKKQRDYLFFIRSDSLPKGPPLIDAPNYPFKTDSWEVWTLFFLWSKAGRLATVSALRPPPKKIPPSCAARNIPTLPFLVSHFHLETDAIITSWFLLFPLTLALLRIDHQVLSATK